MITRVISKAGGNKWSLNGKGVPSSRIDQFVKEKRNIKGILQLYYLLYHPCTQSQQTTLQ